MTSLNSHHHFAEGDTVQDTRTHRTGIITHRPEPGAWVCLGDPDEPDDVYRRWHVMYGDMAPVNGSQLDGGGNA